MKKVLKLKRVHPNGFMQHGRYVITDKPIEYNLNEDELNSLESIGPKHWIEVVGVVEKAPKVSKKVKPKAKVKNK